MVFIVKFDEAREIEGDDDGERRQGDWTLDARDWAVGNGHLTVGIDRGQVYFINVQCYLSQLMVHGTPLLS